MTKSKPVATPRKARSSNRGVVLQASTLALVSRVKAVDWDRVSRGQAKGFEKHFEGLIQPNRAKQDTSRNWMLRSIADYPIAGLASRFLVELARDPEVPGLGKLLELLVRCALGSHEPFLSGDPKARRELLSRRLTGRTRRVRYDSVADGASFLVPHLGHKDPEVRAAAAFFLSWFEGEALGEVVPELRRSVSEERDPRALASALLCFSLHGERVPFENYFQHPDARVALCAAVAQSLLGEEAMSESALAILEGNLPPSVPSGFEGWFPFLQGDLARLGLSTYLGAPARFRERTQPKLLSMLDGPLAASISEALLARAFPVELLDSAELSPFQRDVLLALLPKTPLWMGGKLVSQLCAAGVDLGASTRVARQRETLRRRLDAPRFPPEGKVQTLLTFHGQTLAVAHFWADYTGRGEGDPQALAQAMAEVLSPQEAIDLLCEAQRYEPDPYSEPVNPPLAFPVPEGGEPLSEGRWVFRDKKYMDVVASYRPIWEAAGWELLYPFAHGAMWIGTLHREGQVVDAAIEHDWNQGNPRLSETTFSARTHYRLEVLFARAAAKRHPSFLELLAKSRGEDEEGSYSFALLRSALYVCAPAKLVPPVGLDDVAYDLQSSWNYIQGMYATYLDLLPPERREALVMRSIEKGTLVVELLSLAPTKRVLEVFWPRFEMQFSGLASFSETPWNRHLREKMAKNLGRVSLPKLLELSRSAKTKEDRERAVVLMKLIEAGSPS